MSGAEPVARAVQPSTDSSPTRSEARLESAPAGTGHRLLAIRTLNYLTNAVISLIPSFTLRSLWYRHVLGVQLDPSGGIHRGCYLWFYGPGQLRRTGFVIGAHSRINRDCCLDARGSLRIGDNVSVSPEVVILTASHRVDDPEFRVETRPVVVEDNVWIGTRAMILPGVTLGRGCVVSAGAIVTRDVPPLAIVAGVPARRVGERSAAAATYVLDTGFPLFE
jgi:acetyltransferase-like isoleucine patch superfamily enzyme